MEKAAAFLETRRYAAYVGATTEFREVRGVAVNAADKKVYVAMTRMRDGMENKPGDPTNHIRIPRLLAGAVYEIDLATGQSDTSGETIASDYVGTAMRGLVLGEDIPKDAAGNTAAVDRIANPDNLKYSERCAPSSSARTAARPHQQLPLGLQRRHGKLSRILSLPAGPRAPGSRRSTTGTDLPTS